MESLLGQASRWIDDGEKVDLFRLLAINNQILLYLFMCAGSTSFIIFVPVQISVI
jgi:hypothetical protein